MNFGQIGVLEPDRLVNRGAASEAKTAIAKAKAALDQAAR